MNEIKADTTARQFADKQTLAQRYGVSPRTITNWMRDGLLAYFKVKRVVRFNVAECDAGLRQHGYINHF